MKPFQLCIQNLSKSYGSLTVWERWSLTLPSGRAYCLMGPSGSGKTTLLRILLGLEQPDAGSVNLSELPGPVVAVFQENRLCESFSALDNVLLAAGPDLSRQAAFQELCRLLPWESILRPVSTLSGGMKRRVAIVRALLAPSCAIVMDEPFTGLDEDTKHTVIAYIKEKTAGKLLLAATHQEEDAAALGAEILHVPSAL
ncbi:MAG: ABC transporter ATP-binding protein [Eubacteriales bacterium]|nr:ABC transporter ATP-binding protein [Eubacteriales bacterium]